MTITIPSGLATPTSQRLDLMPINRSAGMALSGQEQVVVGPDQLWVLRQRRKIPTTKYGAWTAFLEQFDGPANTFSFRPGTDGPGSAHFARPSTGTPVLTSAASAAAVTVRVTHTGQASNWAVGMMFNLGVTCHRVVTVSEVDSNTVDLGIRPRIRHALGAGTLLTDPSITMRLADSGEGAMALTGAGYDEIDISFVEVPQSKFVAYKYGDAWPCLVIDNEAGLYGIGTGSAAPSEVTSAGMFDSGTSGPLVAAADTAAAAATCGALKLTVPGSPTTFTYLMAISDATTDEMVRIQGNGTNFYLQIRDGGATTASSDAPAYTTSQNAWLGFVYDGTTTLIAQDGVAGNTGTGVTIPAVNQGAFFTNHDGTGGFNGTALQLVLFTTSFGASGPAGISSGWRG